jgi:hypothetical protein
MVRNYEKGTKGLRRGYEISYQVTKLRKGTKLRKRYEEVTKGLGYEATKLLDSNATYQGHFRSRDLRHFRSKGPTRADMVQLPV